MSGGALDYVHHKIEDAASRIAGKPEPLFRAFAAHLHEVARATKAVEWYLSGDWSKESAVEAMQKVVNPERQLRAALEAALQAKADLDSSLARVEEFLQ